MKRQECAVAERKGGGAILKSGKVRDSVVGLLYEGFLSSTLLDHQSNNREIGFKRSWRLDPLVLISRQL